MFLKSTPSCKGPPKNKKKDMRIIILCLSFMTSIQLYIDVVIATRQGTTESNTTSTNKKKLVPKTLEGQCTVPPTNIHNMHMPMHFQQKSYKILEPIKKQKTNPKRTTPVKLHLTNYQTTHYTTQHHN